MQSELSLVNGDNAVLLASVIGATAISAGVLGLGFYSIHKTGSTEALRGFAEVIKAFEGLPVALR